MQHVRKMYEENNFFAKPHTAIGIQLDGDEIQVGLDQTTYVNWSDGRSMGTTTPKTMQWSVYCSM